MEQDINSEKFRRFLQAEYERRCEKRAQYSIRAFAKKLDMDSSYLSKILKGKKRITESMMRKLAKALGLTSSEYHQIFLETPFRSITDGNSIREIFYFDKGHLAEVELQTNRYLNSLHLISKKGATHKFSIKIN